MKAYIIFACLMVSAIAFDLETEWTNWKKTHKKMYTAAVHDIRKAIFGDNLRFIEKHNQRFQQGLETYEVGLNQFADLTKTEWYNQMFGLVFEAKTQTRNVFRYNASIQADSEVDWRTHNPPIVTPVKDQKHCGSCWAFSTTGSLEGQHALKTGNLVSLSEQQLVDCDNTDNGCAGGLMDRAFDYIKKQGIESENNYPYEAQDGKCKFNKKKVAATLVDYTDIEQNNEEALKQATNKVGPISVAIYAGSAFQLYKSGVLVADDCPPGQLNHGVLVVGYGHDEASDLDYWIVKNSWSSTWGIDGYVKMARNHDNMCGISSVASYPNV
jgi:cathepsin L